MVFLSVTDVPLNEGRSNQTSSNDVPVIRRDLRGKKAGRFTLVDARAELRGASFVTISPGFPESGIIREIGDSITGVEAQGPENFCLPYPAEEKRR